MRTKRFLASALALVMCISLLPFSALATSYDVGATGNYYTVMSKKDYVLCDGATESEIVVNNASGSRRQVLHVMEVDPNNTNVEVLPAYYQIDEDLTDSSNWTAQIMEKQMDYYRDELGYNVVGGMNTALAYDNEAPYGVMVFNGEVLADGSVHPGAQTYLAVIKNDDGTVDFDLRSVSAGLQGDEWHAVSANFGFAIKDGKLVSPTEERTSSPADRSMIGIKADGTLVICQAEGRNAPYAVGLSNYEIGEAMLALGCVWAVNGDGGGSSQFLTKREGENDYSLRNIPSDGSPRPTINGIIVASKAAPTGVFDHVSMIAENQYITGTGSVAIDVKGVDAAGSSAELPASGLTYEATGGTFTNGVFTSDGTLGQQTVTAFYNGAEVGSVSVEVVVPTSIAFNNSEMVVPYSKSVDLGLVGYYGAFEVPLTPNDVTISLANEAIGAISGFTFTAVSTEVENSSSTISVVLKANKDVTASGEISLGKGSEILYDFEDQDLHGFYRGTAASYNYNNPAGETKIVDASTGHVRNGDYAMAVEVDFSNSLEAGFQLGCLMVGEAVALENARTIGMWIYIPDEAVGLRIDSGIPGFGGNWDIQGAQEAKVTEVGFVYAFPESGWYYISKDISTAGSVTLAEKTQLLKFYISQKDGKNGYSYGEQASVNGRYVFYVDDITVDYSSAVDDREAPIFSGMTYATAGMDEGAAMSGQTITTNTVSFTAAVAENTAKNNYTGIDTTSGKVYVDGVDYTKNLVWSGNSRMALNNVTLADGRHEIKFTVCDKMGNYSSIISDIVVNSAEAAPIHVVPHDAEADRILLGSLYYIDVVANAIENVKSVNVTMDLNNISQWELDHMNVTAGFEAEYTLAEDENIATVTITRTGNCVLTGEQVLVSIPTRTWQLAPTVAIYGHAGKVWMYPDYKKGNEILPMDLSVEIDGGLVTYANGSTATFASPRIQVDTELSGNAYTSSGSAANNYIRNEPWYAGWNGGHDHRAETAQYYAEGATNVATPVALEDKPATCTEPGYTGRTYCEVCQSVVDWGTEVTGGGHSYKVVGDELACDCGEIYKGNGLVTVNDKIYYLIADKLVTGWQNADGSWCYVNHDTKEVYTGEFVVSGRTYTADENGIIIKGAWVTDANGTKYSYGPGFYNRTWVEIDGVTYYFGEDSYMFTGYRYIYVNRNNVNEGAKWYRFAEDGAFIADLTTEGNKYTGFLVNNDGAGKKFYVVDGWSTYGGILKIDGDYYYAKWDGELAMNESYTVSKTNGLVPADTYEFDVDGKITNLKNGIVQASDGKLYYYVDGRLAYGGLMLIDGDYYYATSAGEIITDRNYWITKTNDLLPEKKYEFGSDGKMLNPPAVEPDEPGVVKNGIVQGSDGKLYYYENNKLSYGGLMLIDGAYYYATSVGEIITSRNYWITKTNDLLPEKKYEFGADGKMLNPPAVEPDEPGVVKNGIVQASDGKLYYYENNKLTYGGLMYIDGYFYYATSAGEIITDRNYWVTKTNDLLPETKYQFGSDGKMVNPPVIEPDDPGVTPAVKEGIVQGSDGKLYYYENNKLTYGGLMLIDGDYYYATSAGEIITDRNYWITKTNDLMPAAKYLFGVDGKMLNPPKV